jgi:hypothetical protein
VNVNASASASVVVSVSVNVASVIGYVYAHGYEENGYGQRRSVADAAHVFQFARSSARQPLRGPEGQHPLQGHILAMTEVVYEHDAAAADMHDAVGMVAGVTGVGASILQSALLQWA